MKLDIYTLENKAVIDAFAKAELVLPKYNNVVVSVSGGSDSDIVVDICEHVKTHNQTVTYVFFDTGLEYKATKNHLDHLERRYGIVINRLRATKSIPTCVKEYGVPFLSKYASSMISRLQAHGFSFVDDTLDSLLTQFPKCKVALKWWCDCNGSVNSYNIRAYPYLKQFMIENPPTFKISANCCYYAKKKTAEKALNELNGDLTVIGVRKSEGGIRSTVYKSCYKESEYGSIAQFLPIFLAIRL